MKVIISIVEIMGDDAEIKFVGWQTRSEVSVDKEIKRKVKVTF